MTIHPKLKNHKGRVRKTGWLVSELMAERLGVEVRTLREAYQRQRPVNGYYLSRRKDILDGKGFEYFGERPL